MAKIVKTIVDPDLCTACEVCYDRVPEIYKNRGDGIAEVVKSDVPPELQDAVLEVTDECPSGAISTEVIEE
ncbi:MULTISPECIES: ferredoxin [unclassified Hydrogenobaculum]|jgi:hypothetical protein|uniref:ferredoxin n=1 Tax=unclassified Hydrogenobaculum TaxID=2622382 RepID=UPI0001C50382|nr:MULTISPECIES: ferredoxin [unclassified Hydrogenobaculum]AEF19303.1 protein of unknown function DUF1271 [Hydrogenobaculum sp. 3684]AEG46592.1 hypothetical protein HydSHO_0914 [Hydrogenobaculum sp. SHO]AGG15237.1 4Fe-4S ferredoxin [Hydrogenobaculum sp. HO]AGH93535.1 ferredoxin [Hydrogenobaculum sp. SN]